MRSPLKILRNSGINLAAALRRHGRAEERRRGPALVLLASVIAMPFGLAALPAGAVSGFIAAAIGLCSGFAGLVFLREHRPAGAAAALASGAAAVGLWLGLADPAALDPALGLALVVPLMAGALGRHAAWSWLVPILAAAIALLQARGWLILPGQFADHAALAAGLALAVAVVAAAMASAQRSGVAADADATYRRLVEEVRDGVVRFGEDGKPAFVSRSAETLLGCRNYELSGATGLLDRIHVLDRPAYLGALDAVRHAGGKRCVDIRMRRDEPEGQGRVPVFLWIETEFSALTVGSEPDRREVVLLLRDVTSRRDASEAAAAAFRSAEEESRAKSRFLATIGHELRTPLNAIVGFSEMLTSGVAGDLTPTQKEYAALIQQSGRHLVDIVHMLLDMSRLEAGKFELQTGSFDPAAIVGPCVRLLEPTAAARGVRVVLDLAGTLPPLVADERACRQILINLLSNAIKFSAEHGQVTVSMRRQGRHLAIAVADSGIGMSAASVRRIGEPFFQAQDGLDRRYEGTGLGLSIVKGLVDLHQGKLHAASAPGEGTVITVLLPINGPAIKLEDTGAVLPLHRDPVIQQMPRWLDGKRKAQ